MAVLAPAPDVEQSPPGDQRTDPPHRLAQVARAGLRRSERPPLGDGGRDLDLSVCVPVEQRPYLVGGIGDEAVQ